ncbi:unnamed protein product [Phytophthora fragariaefolia]|uniref:Unnamed protein product n=1 Tax=Phytophthora fragariaefolia TaxID=1490495 RepID=A0A9W6XRL0_9STRA|nr:unnamed protein product [Phytophthora fragariaefolia]
MPISWYSKKQSIVALSTAEAEYIAGATADQDCLWVKQLLTELQLHGTYDSIDLYVGNQSAIKNMENDVTNSRMKHINITFHFIRDAIRKKEVNVTYCPTTGMKADIFTKPLGTTHHGRQPGHAQADPSAQGEVVDTDHLGRGLLDIARASATCDERSGGDNDLRRLQRPLQLHRAIRAGSLVLPSGTMDQAASALGISRPRAVVYINETLDVLSAMAKRFVVMPQGDELGAVENSFYSTASFPDTIDAVDGTLVRIARPRNFEGWYCRKNFPVVNFANGNLYALIAALGCNAGPRAHWIELTGYQFGPQADDVPGYPESTWTWWVIWGPPASGQAAIEHVHFFEFYFTNYCWLAGRLKNRFRILLGKLEQKSADRVCKVILCCAVLHNLLVLVQVSVPVRGVDPLLREAPAPAAETQKNASKLFAMSKDLLNEKP